MSLVAVIQMVSTNEVSHNLNEVRRLVQKAHEAGAKLVLLPENFSFMGLHENDKLAIAETFADGPVQMAISRLAEQYGMWIVAGSVFLKSEGTRVRGACLVYDNVGQCVARYDKIHLFDVTVSDKESHQESKTLEPGDAIKVIDTPVGKLGLSICYDIRFAELYVLMAQQGAEIFSIPAAFTYVTGLAHWEVLLRARAIEHLCYVLAANQGGVHANGRQTYGHSAIIDPWGRVMAELDSGSGVIVSNIDLEHLNRIRATFPCPSHHRLNIIARF